MLHTDFSTSLDRHLEQLREQLRALVQAGYVPLSPAAKRTNFAGNSPRSGQTEPRLLMVGAGAFLFWAAVAILNGSMGSIKKSPHRGAAGAGLGMGRTGARPNAL